MTKNWFKTTFDISNTVDNPVLTALIIWTELYEYYNIKNH